MLGRSYSLALSFLIALTMLPLAVSVAEPGIGQPVSRQGDEIMVCGQLFHTTTPVVLWLDPGGYDAYRVERRFSPMEKASWEDSVKEGAYLDTPNRYGMRKAGLNAKQLEKIRGGGWDLPMLQQVVINLSCTTTSVVSVKSVSRFCTTAGV
jgi:N-acetylmuramoyl-L-alanine amidase